jgi:uncharacterized membrane protein YcaP (DUF421 family)
MDETIFWDGWVGPMRTVIVGTLAYVGLVILLRGTGKRTLSKMNAFDLVVTVALGSTLATILLDRTVPLVDGLIAFSLLVCLQYLITWLSVRSLIVQRLVKSEPTVLAKDGRLLQEAMLRTRVTRAEIDAALRDHGVDDLSCSKLVVLETDGTMSVVPATRQ